MTQAPAYLDQAYAAAMAGAGQAIALGACGGGLILRQVPGTDLRDAQAPYPFLVCRDWSQLAQDLDALPPDLVSVTAITDPFAQTTPEDLSRAFPHMVRPYKAHFVIDLTRPLESFADPHHLGCAGRALRRLEVGVVADPSVILPEWLRLYANLVARHGIRGPARMTEAAFHHLLQVSHLTVFRAQWKGATIGMILCLDDGTRAWFHLGAYDAEGYRRNASYAIVRHAIGHFAAVGCQMMNIGAGAGAFGDGTDGLTAFKRGWASGTRMTYLCGRIHAPNAYARLVAQTKTGQSPYFPAYRTGEYD